MRRAPLAAALLALAGAAGLALPAAAQGMTPMLGEVRTPADSFVVTVTPTNPYRHPITVDIRVYDQDFRPVRARIRPESFLMAAGSRRTVTVVVPFDLAMQRRIRICTESVPEPGVGQPIKTQICGKFLATRL
jgi:hypothetical protein